MSSAIIALRSATLASVLLAPLLAADPKPAKVTEPKLIRATTGSLFSPGDAPSLGRLSVGSGGAVTFDTGSKDTPPTVSGAVKGMGALGSSKAGQVQVAVFAFDTINLADGATVTITGDRALVLVTKETITINTTLSVAGATGSGVVKYGGDTATWYSLTAGGPGAEGGDRGGTPNSAPPPTDGGNGGPPMKDHGIPGRGIGAGLNYRCQGATGGSGAGYGGAGGATSEGSKPRGHEHDPRALPGGPAYGDEALSELFGGSGGAGGSNDRGGDNGGGGGGGGAISLVALKTITIGSKGRIVATGGAGLDQKCGGGGGSGGAILLAAPAIELKPGSLLDASGGVGGTGGPNVAAELKGGSDRHNYGSGGGGGGGRIACYSRTDLGAPGKNKIEAKPIKGTLVAGGAGGAEAKNGADGTFFDGNWPGLH